MRELFESGGVMMWPLLFIGLGILAAAVSTAIGLGRGSPPDAFGRRIESILFWGAMSVVLGLLGTLIGLIQMARMIEWAGNVPPAIVWSGVGVSLITLLFGTLLFVVSLLCWYGLRSWSSRRTAPLSSAVGYQG